MAGGQCVTQGSPTQFRGIRVFVRQVVARAAPGQPTGGIEIAQGFEQASAPRCRSCACPSGGRAAVPTGSAGEQPRPAGTARAVPPADRHRRHAANHRRVSRTTKPECPAAALAWMQPPCPAARPRSIACGERIERLHCRDRVADATACQHGGLAGWRRGFRQLAAPTEPVFALTRRAQRQNLLSCVRRDQVALAVRCPNARLSSFARPTSPARKHCKDRHDEACPTNQRVRA